MNLKQLVYEKIEGSLQGPKLCEAPLSELPDDGESLYWVNHGVCEKLKVKSKFTGVSILKEGNISVATLSLFRKHW